MLDALSRLNEQTDLTVELGDQTIHDETAERIHRGHSFEEFLPAIERFKNGASAPASISLTACPGKPRRICWNPPGYWGRCGPGA